MPIKYYHELQQGTEDWLRTRLGVLSASCMKLLLTPTYRPAKNDKVKQLTYEIAAQRETQNLEEAFQSWDMERGHIEEELARDLYSKNIEKVNECGFIINNELGFPLGFSPDGLVGDEGFIEVKSRRQKYQTETIYTNDMPLEFMLQVQTGLIVSGRSWCDFVSYSNGMPMFIKRIYPDFALQDAIKMVACKFEESVQEVLSVYRENAKDLIKTVWIDYQNEEAITASGV